MTLKEVKKHNQMWFAPGNVKFAQDHNYELQLGASGKAYLVRETSGWSDMFDGIKKRHYRINPISEEYKIMTLIPESFSSREAVNNWLAEN